MNRIPNRAGTLLLAALLLLTASPAGCKKDDGNESTTQVTGDELLTQLRSSMSQPINSAEEDQALSQLVQQVTSEGLLLGLTVAEVEAKLGPSLPCGDGSWCTFFELEPTDRYYEVSTSAGFASGTPMIMLGFDSTGGCDSVQLAHGQ